jgi:hypothetical protein
VIHTTCFRIEFFFSRILKERAAGVLSGARSFPSRLHAFLYKAALVVFEQWRNDTTIAMKVRRSR